MEVREGLFTVIVVGTFTSVLGSAIWSALDPDGGSPLSGIATTVGLSPPGWGYIAIVMGAYLGSFAIWLLMRHNDVHHAGPWRERQLEGTRDSVSVGFNAVGVAFWTILAVVILAVPVGLVVAAQVVLGDRPGGSVVTVLAYFPLGAAAVGVASFTWVPIALAIAALEREVQFLRRQLNI